MQLSHACVMPSRIRARSHYTDRSQLTFKIPEQTPAGQYLMRMDVPWSGMINPYIHHGEALTQLYPSCAQINVRSKATGQLPKGVKIPEIFSPDVPGGLAPFCFVG